MAPEPLRLAIASVEPFALFLKWVESFVNTFEVSVRGAIPKELVVWGV